MKTVDSVTFSRARRLLDPAGLVGIPEAYEATWLAEPSPFPGRVDRLLHHDAQGVVARLVVLRPADGSEAMFCFYGRRAELSPSARVVFFSALVRWLEAEGIRSIQGPIEFSTWHPYRFVIARGSSPWFPGEQPMPDYGYTDFIAGGFTVSARFVSGLVVDLAQSIEVGLAIGVDQGLSGLAVRNLHGADIVSMLPTLYPLSTTIFEQGYAYSPIDYQAFHQLYARVAALDAAVIVLEDDQGPMGLAFSYNIGPYSPGPGEPARPTAVLKTIGVHPRARQRRLGFGLGFLTHELWLARGTQRIIHAYMKSDNVSRSMSAHFGGTLREYALVRWRADP